jgi:RNA polymerase sigma-70 factor, ECF subfamily
MKSPSATHERFTSLVSQHQRALLKVCWAYAYSHHDRDDLFQEIASRLWSAFDRYDESRPFLTWMYRVALNVAIDFRRRKLRWSKESVGLEDEESALDDGDDLEKREQLAELRELFERQSDGDRAILLLHLEGNSHREIGEVLGMSETNVGTRLNRLKNSLRQSVQDTASAKGP